MAIILLEDYGSINAFPASDEFYRIYKLKPLEIRKGDEVLSKKEREYVNI
jgi:hypothetical protein